MRVKAWRATPTCTSERVGGPWQETGRIREPVRIVQGTRLPVRLELDQFQQSRQPAQLRRAGVAGAGIHRFTAGGGRHTRHPQRAAPVAGHSLRHPFRQGRPQVVAGAGELRGRRFLPDRGDRKRSGVVRLRRADVRVGHFGVIDVAQTNWSKAYVFDVVGEKRAVNGLAMEQLANKLFGMFGGFAGGLLLFHTGAGGIYLAMAVSYALGGTAAQLDQGCGAICHGGFTGTSTG